MGGWRTSHGRLACLQAGDIVGCFLDLNDRTISFSLNGELLLDPSGSEMAFDNVHPAEGFVRSLQSTSFRSVHHSPSHADLCRP